LGVKVKHFLPFLLFMEAKDKQNNASLSALAGFVLLLATGCCILNSLVR
jgi:hypothetical protein